MPDGWTTYRGVLKQDFNTNKFFWMRGAPGCPETLMPWDFKKERWEYLKSKEASVIQKGVTVCMCWSQKELHGGRKSSVFNLLPLTVMLVSQEGWWDIGVAWDPFKNDIISSEDSQRGQKVAADWDLAKACLGSNIKAMGAYYGGLAPSVALALNRSATGVRAPPLLSSYRELRNQCFIKNPWSSLW